MHILSDPNPSRPIFLHGSNVHHGSLVVVRVMNQMFLKSKQTGFHWRPALSLQPSLNLFWAGLARIDNLNFISTMPTPIGEEEGTREVLSKCPAGARRIHINTFTRVGKGRTGTGLKHSCSSSPTLHRWTPPRCTRVPQPYFWAPNLDKVSPPCLNLVQGR